MCTRLTVPTVIYKRLILIVLALFLSACQTLDTSKDWPNDVPDRKLFVDDYLQKRGLKKADPQKLNAHLGWIVRFFQGTVIYPNGWNRASEMLLASIEDPDTEQLANQKINDLGIRIAMEWAQDNGIRKINSTNIATWGSALRRSAEVNDQIEFLNKIDNDVEGLISGKLNFNDITYERYYQDEDFDSF